MWVELNTITRLLLLATSFNPAQCIQLQLGSVGKTTMKIRGLMALSGYGFMFNIGSTVLTADLFK